MAITLVNHDPQSAFRPIASIFLFVFFISKTPTELQLYVDETLARQAASRAQCQRPQARAPPQPCMGSHVIPQNTQVRAASAPDTQDTDFTPSMFVPPSNHANFSNLGFDDDQWPSFSFNASAQSNGYQRPLDEFDEAELLEMQDNPEANVAQGPVVPLPANSVNADEQLTLADLLPPTGPSCKWPHDAIEEEDDEDIIATWGPDEDTPALPNKKSVHAADLNPSCWHILDWALCHYQFLTMKGPYPTTQEVDKQSVESWYAALKEMNQEFNYIGDSPPTEDELALIKMWLAQLRGQIKVHAWSAVAPFYGFKNSSDINTINRICETVQTLKHKHNYRDTKEKGGLYRMDLISSVINFQWYDNKLNSEAIRMLTVMWPISL
ncbi:uncharacterized protein LACBIDRAFT_324498 [Laccaria bicolor S238N-H82]|uniref:Predicted protein n=1 Tax=Laccaria bicolor (strain S238N-H82 / ATCC MYA-4686) TaxID=486041 RepID=B0D205_LACBS|nr:uncharacterized protein LACBIDRAFT_324498 [Laccaria bicolor S238N-H82]EDR12081.1 predicted protein [Laccaria bicolor S238N-H82]|eukprot:XP_001877978.1 predicted protein [Laccaria bicolor S238N-H82]